MQNPLGPTQGCNQGLMLTELCRELGRLILSNWSLFLHQEVTASSGAISSGTDGEGVPDFLSTGSGFVSVTS